MEINKQEFEFNGPYIYIWYHQPNSVIFGTTIHLLLPLEWLRDIFYNLALKRWCMI